MIIYCFLIERRNKSAWKRERIYQGSLLFNLEKDKTSQCWNEQFYSIMAATRFQGLVALRLETRLRLVTAFSAWAVKKHWALMEGTAAKWKRSGSKCCRFKTQCKQGLFTGEYPLISTLLLMICVHIIDSCVSCTGWLYVCLTCEGCYISSIDIRSTRVVATS